MTPAKHQQQMASYQELRANPQGLNFAAPECLQGVSVLTADLELTYYSKPCTQYGVVFTLALTQELPYEICAIFGCSNPHGESDVQLQALF